MTQEYLWTKVSSWFREGDIIITETGTSAFGIVQSRFPKNSIGISQVLWGSIGYTVGATCGAAMAAQELDPKRRVILFVGDGSLQLTVQEISTMCKWECNNTYLFVLNNDGYTIERLIHGEKAQYNDIQPWNNLQLLPLFNAKDYETKRISTVGELNDLFADKALLFQIRLEWLKSCFQLWMLQLTWLLKLNYLKRPMLNNKCVVEQQRIYDSYFTPLLWCLFSRFQLDKRVL